jgi:hypothetical protein
MSADIPCNPKVGCEALVSQGKKIVRVDEREAAHKKAADDRAEKFDGRLGVVEREWFSFKAKVGGSAAAGAFIGGLIIGALQRFF